MLTKSALFEDMRHYLREHARHAADVEYFTATGNLDSPEAKRARWFAKSYTTSAIRCAAKIAAENNLDD